MRFKLITPPSIEPITLDEARTLLRIDVPGYAGDSGQDSLIRAWVRAARQWCEKEIDYAIGAQTLLAVADRFGALRNDYSRVSPWDSSWADGWCELQLPLGPVRSITSIKYVATDGTDTTINPTAYRLTVSGRLLLASPSTPWPSARCEPDSVRVTYVAGYGVPGDRDQTFERIGEDVMSAMRLLLGHFYVNRKATVEQVTSQELPLGVKALLWQSRRSIGV